MRKLLLSEELLQVPETIKHILAIQEKTGEYLESLTKRLDTLTARINSLTEQVQVLTQRTARVDSLAEQVQILTERMDSLVQQFEILVSRVETMDNTIARLKRYYLEQTYSTRAYSYFGSIIRKVQRVDISAIEETLELNLSNEEFKDLILLDLLVKGRMRLIEGDEVWLAVEVSSTIDENDVERAVRRASFLKKASFKVLPVVAGESIKDNALNLLKIYKAILVKDGEIEFLEDSVSSWL